ncbi:unnamed protein product [Caenorhabditis brenneri]
MSEALRSDANQPMEQPNNDLSEVIGQLSLTTDDSDKPSTPPRNLSDMPVDVVGLIIERSDYKEQLVLRKTSKSLRKLVDKQRPSCKRFRVSCKLDCVICSYNGHCVAYVSPNWDQDYSWSKYKDYRINTIIWKTDYEEVAFDDLASMLKNPKLPLEYFSFDTEKFDSYEKNM